MSRATTNTANPCEPERIESGLTGTIKFYDEKRGFGCVNADDGRALYVHHTGLATKGFAVPQPEARVQFDLARSERPSGPRFEPGVLAVNVQPIH